MLKSNYIDSDNMSILYVQVVIILWLLYFGIGRVFAVEYIYEGWCNQGFSMFTKHSGSAGGYKFPLYDKEKHGEIPANWDSEHIMLEVSVPIMNFLGLSFNPS